MFEFEITAQDSQSSARTGKFHTPHGSFHTPAFMPCGTKGAVKTLTPDELTSLGCEIMLSNTYHLMLRPGGEAVAKMGGLQKWISWNKPILTDSGGFQVFSLSKLRKIDDNGVTFQSHIDGSTHLLTPERSIEIQEQLGADIIMAFDECAPGQADHAYAKQAMMRTHNWALRSFKAKTRQDQALFPIIQGATYTDLRRESAQFMSQISAPGIAIGGVAVGESKEKILEAVETVEPLMPKKKPRYLMGVGEPADIVNAVARGMDMFDCVLPTRLARHGSFWTRAGRRSIEKSQYKLIEEPLEKNCACYTCRHFSCSYLQHLMVEKEILGARLLTIHNLHFLLDLLRQIRAAIAEGRFKTLAKNFLSEYDHEQEEKPA